MFAKNQVVWKIPRCLLGLVSVSLCLLKKDKYLTSSAAYDDSLLPEDELSDDLQVHKLHLSSVQPQFAFVFAFV